MNKKNKCIVLILLFILFIFFILLILIKSPINISKILNQSLGLYAEKKFDVKCLVYDNCDEMRIKAVLLINSEDIIDKIEYISEMENKVINTNGNKNVALDIIAEKDKEYSVYIIQNGIKTEKNYIITDDLINSYTSIKRYDEEVGKYTPIEIEFKPAVQGKMSYYYKIGENNPNWTSYTGKFNLNLADIEYPDYFFGGKLSKIYTKIVDSAGNTVISDVKNVTVESKIFDVFENAKISNKSLDEYGFIRSLYNCERSTYTYNDMGAGHWSGRGSYSGSFKIDYDKFKSLNAKGVQMGCYLQADGNANITGKVVAYYTDGTNTSAQTWTRADGAIGKFDYASTSITFEQDKEVDYLLFYLWGYDGSGAGSQGYVSDILLFQ